MKVKRVQIESFRAFEKFDLDDLPTDLIFVIGRNASGKSNFVAALRAIRTAIIGGQTVMSEDVRSTSPGSPAVIGVDVELDPEDHSQLQAAADRAAPETTQRERMLSALSEVSEVRLAARFTSHEPGQPAAYTRQIELLNQSGGSVTIPGNKGVTQATEGLVAEYIARRLLCLGPIRSPTASVSPTAQREMEYNATNLGNALYPMVAGYTPPYERLIAELREIFPFIERPVVPPNPSPPAVLDVSFREEGLPQPVRIDRASSGQVEALSIVLQLVSAPKGSFVSLEEPESHFHADALKKLTSLIKRHAESGLQILVASHSTQIVSSNIFPVEQKVYLFHRDAAGPTKCTELSRERDIALIEQALEG
jgi:predicted ATPase